MKRLFLICLAALSMIMVVAGPVAAAPGGNSVNAKLCQKGGWQTLARSGDAGTPFLNGGECTSFAAQGGTLVDYVVLVPTVTVVMELAYSGGSGYCVPQVTATGFAPETTYDVDAYFNGSLAQEYPIETDADGTYNGTSISYAQNNSFNFQIVIGGVASPVVQYFC